MNRAKLYSYSDGSKFIGKTAKEIFNEIESENVWQETESVSGIGSSIEQTKEIVEQLPKVLELFKVKSIFDIPCGDFNWFKKLELTKLQYTGGDIVEKIILSNKEKYETTNISFINFNLLSDIAKPFDMVFCRDCLVHFSFDEITKAILNIKQSGSKFLMTTTFPDENENTDIQTGGWRPLNLEKAPFNFPKPNYILNEKCTEMNGVFKDKSLALWEIDKL